MEPKIRRQYTADYKAQAVSLAGAARKLGMSAKTLANWVRLDRSGTPVSSSKRRAVSDIEAENSRLRTENATLRMEREVLKKATAFFAKESR